jgi:hypothetical protein
MNRIAIGALVLALGVIPAAGQSLEDLNIQIHGYATQGLLYTTNNNILTTNSSDGSPAWSEVVVNVTSQPNPKLRVAVQARYFMLGLIGDQIILDWAAADYKYNEKLGVRFGKVKTPLGLLNETQDIDPSYQWALLPQGVYPLMSRTSNLAHYGGVLYGQFKLGPQAGKLEYRLWGGDRQLNSQDGVFLTRREIGIYFPNGLGGATFGAALHWKATGPLDGLMLGVSDYRNAGNWMAPILKNFGTTPGTETAARVISPNYFGIYEKNKVMVAAEYNRYPILAFMNFPSTPTQTVVGDRRSWYAMATYKLSGKLAVGVYDSQIVDHKSAFTAAQGRYMKDWTFNGKYDFNQFIYAKVEEHIIKGTDYVYDSTMNPGGLKPDTKLTVFKIGVSF